MVCVRAEYAQGALLSIPFNLICNITTFIKKYLVLTPPPGLRVCLWVKSYYHVAACVIPFNLIYNMNIF